MAQSIAERAERNLPTAVAYAATHPEVTRFVYKYAEGDAAIAALAMLAVGEANPTPDDPCHPRRPASRFVTAARAVTVAKLCTRLAAEEEAARLAGLVSLEDALRPGRGEQEIAAPALDALHRASPAYDRPDAIATATSRDVAVTVAAALDRRHGAALANVRHAVALAVAMTATTGRHVTAQLAYGLAAPNGPTAARRFRRSRDVLRPDASAVLAAVEPHEPVSRHTDHGQPKRPLGRRSAPQPEPLPVTVSHVEVVRDALGYTACLAYAVPLEGYDPAMGYVATFDLIAAARRSHHLASEQVRRGPTDVERDADQRLSHKAEVAPYRRGGSHGSGATGPTVTLAGVAWGRETTSSRVRPTR